MRGKLGFIAMMMWEMSVGANVGGSSFCQLGYIRMGKLSFYSCNGEWQWEKRLWGK